MQQFLGWVRNNKFAAVLLIVIALLLLKHKVGGPVPLMQREMYSDVVESSKMMGAPAMGGMGRGVALDSYSFVEPQVPPTQGADRMIVRDTSLSLQVKNVSETIGKVEEAAVAAGGYMVDSNLNVPEGAASGAITIRVPAERRKEVLDQLRGMAVKVVSESVMGTDVTDEFVDLEARLEVLDKTKAKFEEILDSAVRVEDLLNVQRELVNLQSQIDSLRGQQQFLSQTAKLSRISVYLSTDEFALPYTPDQPWRPEVIFKQAVRSLVGLFRSLGTLVIWLVVYAVIWIPVGLLVWWVMKKSKTN